MQHEHITTWQCDDSGVAWSAYRKQAGEFTYWLKVGTAVIEIKDSQIEAVQELLIEIKKDIKEIDQMEFDINNEDMFTVDEDGWMTVPGQGKVSPEGILYSMDGSPLFSIYDDSVVEVVES